MKIIECMLLCCLLMFSGCVHAPWQTVSSPASSDTLAGLADHAAGLVAAEYPPGHTLLALTSQPSGDFAQALETNLRNRGFALSAAEEPEAGSLAVSVVMEPVADGELWYLLLKAADGFSCGQVYTLTADDFAPVGAMTRTERFVTVEEASTELPSSSSPPPSPVASSIEEWQIEPGLLQPQLTKWCSRAGYQLIWKAENDYVMEASAIFRDEFLGAVQRLFTRMLQSGHGLRVRIYPENHVLEVMED